MTPLHPFQMNPIVQFLKPVCQCVDPLNKLNETEVKQMEIKIETSDFDEESCEFTGEVVIEHHQADIEVSSSVCHGTVRYISVTPIFHVQCMSKCLCYPNYLLLNMLNIFESTINQRCKGTLASNRVL